MDEDTNDSLTDPDQYRESYSYFAAVASASIEEDFFEIEMTKALEEIFYNLRQLRESRYKLEKRRLLSMDNGQELEHHAFCHEFDKETENTANDFETEAGLENQVTDKVVPLDESRSELNRRLRMGTEKSELVEVVPEVAQYVRVGPYSEGSEIGAEQLKESRCELNRRWSVKVEKNDLSDKSLHHGEETKNVTENFPEIETAAERQQVTVVDVVQVKEDGFKLNRRLSMQLALGDDSFQRVIRAKNEGNNPGNEAMPEKQDQVQVIIQDKSHFPRRRQLPLLPTVNKSS